MLQIQGFCNTAVSQNNSQVVTCIYFFFLSVPLLHFYFQYVLPMELITSESFGKWMQIFQTVIARDVPQV